MKADFLTQLRKAREAATPTPWDADCGTLNHGDHWVGGDFTLTEDAELICLLVNNAEKIERLIEECTEHYQWCEMTSTIDSIIAELNQ